MIRIFVTTPEEKHIMKEMLTGQFRLLSYIRDQTYSKATCDNIIELRDDMCSKCGSLDTMSRIRVQDYADNVLEVKCNKCKFAKATDLKEN